LNLAIRHYVPGRDEQTWVDIYNRAWREDEDFVPETVEDAKRWDNAPWLGVRLRLIAEVDGTPVAMVNAETDKTTTDRKGYLGGPHVVPEHRRRGIGTALVRQALPFLHAAGMETAEAYTFDAAPARGFLGSHGFKVVRRFSRMRRPLVELPAGVGEAGDVDIVPLGRTDEDIGLMVRLRNEAFREHFNYTPETVDEWKFVLKNWDDHGDVAYIAVALVAGALSDRGRRGQPAGFLSYGYDPEKVRFLNTKRGGLWDLGVLKQFRSRGIAKRLMVDAMHHLRREGMEEVELGVDETNVTHAMKLYEKLGFKVARRRLTWNKKLP